MAGGASSSSVKGCDKHCLDAPKRLDYVIDSGKHIRRRFGGCIRALRQKTQSCGGSRGTGATENGLNASNGHWDSNAWVREIQVGALHLNR